MTHILNTKNWKQSSYEDVFMEVLRDFGYFDIQKIKEK